MKAGAVGIAGLIAVGIAAYLISKAKAKLIAEVESYEGDIQKDPREVIISEENIEEIARDIALEELQYISDLELALNEKLVQAQEAQVEVVHFQSISDTLKGQISSERYRIDSTHNPLIQNAKNALDTAEANEQVRYSAYIELTNQANDLIHQIEYFRDLINSHPWNFIAVAMDMVNINLINEQLADLRPIQSNAWLINLDAISARETAESNYNSALLAKQNDGVYLDQLNRDLVAATNSLNTWKIAYQAANNVISGIQTQIAELQAQIV